MYSLQQAARDSAQLAEANAECVERPGLEDARDRSHTLGPKDEHGSGVLGKGGVALTHVAEPMVG